MLETDTFRSNRLTLKEYRLDDRVIEINVAAASLARRVADRFSTPERPRYVAGSIGPSGFLPSASDPSLGNITYEELVVVFEEQARGLIQGGVDVLLIETSQDLLEVKAAITGCRAAIQGFERWALGFDVSGWGPPPSVEPTPGQSPKPKAQSPASPRSIALQVQITLDPSGRMLLGTDIAAAATVLDALRADVIGLNCSTGPDHMRQPVRWLTENTTLPISVIPNAGIPHNEGGQAVYPLGAEALADAHEEFVLKYGVNVVGGCCGTTPEHLRAVVDRVWGKKPAARDVKRVPRLASAITAFDIAQIPAPTIVGERVNTQGSRAVKRALIDDDYDAVVDRRARPAGGRRAPARRVRRAHRAERRSRADAEARQAARAVGGDAAGHRLDRGRRRHRRAAPVSRAARSSTPSTWRAAGSASRRWCRRRSSTAPRWSR